MYETMYYVEARKDHLCERAWFLTRGEAEKFYNVLDMSTLRKDVQCKIDDDLIAELYIPVLLSNGGRSRLLRVSMGMEW